jgi:hypothetical protein
VRAVESTQFSCCHELVMSQLPASEDVSMEAKEYTWLGAITRQQLVRPQKTLCAVVQSFV